VFFCSDLHRFADANAKNKAAKKLRQAKVFSALNLGTYEEGGRNLSERPDKSNHPEATVEGVAISLASANA